MFDTEFDKLIAVIRKVREDWERETKEYSVVVDGRDEMIMNLAKAVEMLARKQKIGF